MNHDNDEIASGKHSEAQAVDRIQHPIVGLWVDASVELPEPKRRVLVFTEHYAKSGSFSPFQFARHTEARGWIVDGETRCAQVTHWAKLIKPNPAVRGREPASVPCTGVVR